MNIEKFGCDPTRSRLWGRFWSKGGSWSGKQWLRTKYLEVHSGFQVEKKLLESREVVRDPDAKKQG